MGGQSKLDAAVLGVLEQRHGEMTYVIRNVLDSWRHVGWKGLKTRQVLTACHRLERSGQVQELHSGYSVQKCWAITESGRQALKDTAHDR